jgi:hypothetical protein
MIPHRELSPAAIRLGYAGLIPQAIFLTMAIGGGEAKWAALAGGYAYAALILSFLGGIWWGQAMIADRPRPTQFVAAVMPSLIGLACFMPWVLGFAWQGPYFVVLGLALVLSPVVDARLFDQDQVPDGWIELRRRLSLALGALTGSMGLI